MSAFAISLLGLLAGLLLVAAATDIRSRVIPNALNAAVALLAVPWWLAIGLDATGVAVQLALAAGVLLLFAICFALGMIGGGDVKLLAALALWLPFDRMAVMLVWMALIGGVVTIAMLGWSRLRRSARRIEVPYGVAIAAATLMIVANDILTTPTA